VIKIGNCYTYINYRFFSLLSQLANCGSCKAGHEWLLNSTDWPIDSLVTNNKKIVCKNCIDWLLHEDSDLNSSAAALAYVLTRYKVGVVCLQSVIIM